MGSLDDTSFSHGGTTYVVTAVLITPDDPDILQVFLDVSAADLLDLAFHVDDFAYAFDSVGNWNNYTLFPWPNGGLSLVAGQSYTLRISARAPDAPTALTLTARDGYIAATWDAPADNDSALTEWTVEWRMSGCTAWRDSKTFPATPAHEHDSLARHAHYAITGLADGTAYDVRVAAHNAIGRGAWALEQTAGDPGSCEPSRTPTPDPRPDPAPNRVPSFGTASVADQSWTWGEAIAPLTLPAATGGDGALVYDLTSEPAGLAGLSFDPATRTLSGTPAAGGSHVFTYRAEDADTNRSESDAAVLTFAVTVETVLSGAEEAVKRTLAAVGMRTLGSALANIGVRLADTVPGPSLMLAGQSLGFGGPGATGAAGEEAIGLCAAGGYERHGPWRPGTGEPGCGSLVSRSVRTDALLGASAFSLRLGAAGADPPAPRWSLWGRGDFGTFEGRPDAGSHYRGETRTGWLGFDARSGPWVAGAALSHGTSEADYDLNPGGGMAGQGRLETTLTALYPYGRWTFANGLELRGVLGAGDGEARHAPEGAAPETSDLTMWMGSVG